MNKHPLQFDTITVGRLYALSCRVGLSTLNLLDFFVRLSTSNRTWRARVGLGPVKSWPRDGTSNGSDGSIPVLNKKS